jgi:hypothetical protein
MSIANRVPIAANLTLFLISLSSRGFVHFAPAHALAYSKSAQTYSKFVLSSGLPVSGIRIAAELRVVKSTLTK